MMDWKERRRLWEEAVKCKGESVEAAGKLIKECREKGITLGSGKKSLWPHAGFTPEMEEWFIASYQVLFKLAEEGVLEDIAPRFGKSRHVEDDGLQRRYLRIPPEKIKIYKIACKFLVRNLDTLLSKGWTLRGLFYPGGQSKKRVADPSEVAPRSGQERYIGQGLAWNLFWEFSTTTIEKDGAIRYRFPDGARFRELVDRNPR